MTSKILVSFIRFYQLTLSSVMGNHCRFYPSCSSYCIEAIQIHGSVKGLYLALKRIVRCHPYCDGGLDPVPDQSPANK